MSRLFFAILFFCALCRANPLGEYLRQAQESHPSLVAERALVEQSVRSHEEVAEFLDPTLYGSLGGASHLRDLPVEPSAYDATDVSDSLEGQAGVLIPVKGGAYLTAGGIYRRWFEPDESPDDLSQHLLGVKLQIPLMRDRGFALYGYRRAAALAEVHAALHQLQDAEQRVRREVTQAFIRLCAAQADCQVWHDATARFQRIHREASDMAGLKAIPDYQVQTALRELQGGLADEDSARQSLENARIALGQSMGLRDAVAPAEECSPEALLQAAREASSEVPVLDQETLRRRGSYLVLLDQREKAEAEAAREAESRKDQLSLNAGVTWQAESRQGALSSYRIASEHNWGGEVMLVWSRPLDYTGPEAALARASARLEELDARREALAVEITGEIRIAQLRVEGARRRLEMVASGVEAARKTLEAEQERFRLGESTSAIVLDAQKELNNILLRQNSTAAELLLAQSELAYALGYPTRSGTLEVPSN